MDGVVVIGEGEKDEAPMLHNGERVGDGSAPAVDIAVDPLEGTRLCALGMPNALAVIALSEQGSMFDPGPCVSSRTVLPSVISSRSASLARSSAWRSLASCSWSVAIRWSAITAIVMPEPAQR